MKSLFAAVVGALAIGLLGASCSSGERASVGGTHVNNDEAATVDGVGIRHADFDADLQDYAHNTLFVKTGLGGEASAAVGSDFIRNTLRADILFELVRQEVGRRKLTVPPLDDAAVRAPTIARFDKSGSPDIFNVFPKRFQDRALGQTANVVALQDALGGGPVDDAKVKATYDAAPGRFGQICVRHILLTTENDAKRVLTELQQGADFATTVAKETEDTSTAPNGGKIANPDGSCPTASQLDADFASGALAATPGQPAGPVKTKLGWHVILVDQVNVLPFEQVKNAAAAAAEQDVATKAAPALGQFLREAAKGKITVDAAYGEWDTATHQILPPGVRPPPPPTPADTSTTA